MIEVPKFNGTKEENYALCLKQIKAMINGEPSIIANLSNVSSLLNQALTEINWVGFYLYEETSNQLVLGPFQGLPACIRIPLGKGVCGVAAESGKSQIVANVNEFDGHIACDAKTNSEIVIPLFKNGQRVGVLDIDSPNMNRFDETDQKWLEKVCELLVNEMP
ncbi:GAF domain-containing protein [Listeria sp. PSOL-1]|uniref:GAF domain-containing protein n=1 Tax=Listeria sp. PSOL-1 TaxID=1844999 RepID=UPI0013D79100|nr:GAF domain-containing protein [Listeria sp. PSOL-1]